MAGRDDAIVGGEHAHGVDAVSRILFKPITVGQGGRVGLNVVAPHEGARWIEPPAARHQHAHRFRRRADLEVNAGKSDRSEEHTSELQSLMRISYAVFCL